MREPRPGDEIDCFDFLDRLQVVVCSSNLADNRTLAIPVAHTIYFEMGATQRASMGIADSLIRLSIGIEDPDDLTCDFERALTTKAANIPTGMPNTHGSWKSTMLTRLYRCEGKPVAKTRLAHRRLVIARPLPSASDAPFTAPP
jgi:hypothetical protein